MKLQLFELHPLPCPHDLAGRPHGRRSELLSCLNTNGVPGFDFQEIHLADVRRSK